MSDFKQSPILSTPDSVETFSIPGTVFNHRVKCKDTGGVFSVIELITEPGMGVAPHVHENEDELVYLLQGEIEVTLGDQTMRAVPGVMALLPRGISHGFTNIGTTPSIIIDTILPGQFDNYFAELAALYKSGEPNQEVINQLSEKYSIRYV